MISHEELEVLSQLTDCGYMPEMARELLELRKAATCQHQWETLKLVECGGSYQYCRLCGNKKVAAATTPHQ